MKPRKFSFLNFMPWFLIASGVSLRFLFPTLIEFKGDQIAMFELAKLPFRLDQMGIPSSQGIVNPGLSVWVFQFLARFISLFSELNPVSLSMGVAFFSSLSLILAAVWGRRLLRMQYEGESGEIFLWGVALTAVSPIELILHRNIWAQSMLPVFVVLWFFSLLNWVAVKSRARFWAALAGALALLPGQIHMPAFFFSFGALCYLLVRHLRGRSPLKEIPFFFLGLALSALPMLPWLIQAVDYSKSAHSGGGLGSTWVEFGFVTHYFSHALGLDSYYTLGRHYSDFVVQPWVVIPTLGIVIFSVFGVKGLRAFLRSKSGGEGLSYWLRAFVMGYGLVMLALGFRFYTHYLCALFPWVGVSVAYYWYRAYPKNLAVNALSFFALCQLAISVSLLVDLHERGGAPEGDFGVSYGVKFLGESTRD